MTVETVALLRQSELDTEDGLSKIKALERAEAYIAELEQENNMLRTSNMPMGSGEPQPADGQPLIVIPSVFRVDNEPQPVKVYRGQDLGPQTRDVVNTKTRHNHTLSVTFATNCVYEIEFIEGRAKVPTQIADYIQQENPGNCMRTV